MSNVIYSKYSNDRDERFNIITEIVKDEAGVKWVLKRPFTLVAENHVSRMVESSEMLKRHYQGTSVEVADITRCESGVKVAWVEGEAFSDYLDRLYEKGEVNKWKEKIDEYFENIFAHRRWDVCSSAEFEQVFGTPEKTEKIEIVDYIDIDILFANVIYANGKWTIYDCEWVMPFPVPVKFLIYRCLLYYANTQSKIGSTQESIYDKFDITKDERQIFEKMEDNLQKYIAGNRVPMWRLYQSIHGNVVNIGRIYDKYMEQVSAQVFYDYGDGFSEENSKPVLERENGANDRVVRLSIPEGTTGIRFDPAGGACVIKLGNVKDEKGSILQYITNGQMINRDTYLYLHVDPQIVIRDFTGKWIQIEYEIHFVNGNDDVATEQANKLLTELIEDNDNLAREMRKREEDIRKQTKQLEEKSIIFEKQAEELSALRTENAFLKEMYQQKDTVLDQILHSKRWKICNIFRRK